MHTIFFFFFFNDTATTEIYTLSLHDALPISLPSGAPSLGQCLGAGETTLRQTPDRKSTRLNSSHLVISYAVFCLKKKKKKYDESYRLESECEHTSYESTRRHIGAQ